jgi:hypothetical protein
MVDTLTFFLFLWFAFLLALIALVAIASNKDKIAEKALSIIGKIAGTSSDEDGEK